MNSAQLDARGKELAKKLSDIESNTEMTEAERTKAFDDMAPDIAKHMEAVNNSERAAEYRKGLNLGNAVDEGPGNGIDIPRARCANLKGMNEYFSREILKSPTYAQMVADLGGPKHGKSGDLPIGAKGTFDYKFEIGVKDATQTGNTMGEGFFGSGTPSGAGQNPFLAGAWGPGILPQFIPGVVEQRLYELTISDLFSSMPSQSPDMSYLVESTLNEQAAATAEGGTFPFSSNQFTRKYEQIGKVANAAQVTDELVRDAPYLFSFLQTRLIEGVQRQEEVQLLAGGGYPGVNGLLNRASSFTQGVGGITGSNIAFPASGTAGAGVQSATISSLAYGRQALGTGEAGTPANGLTVAEAIFSAIVDIQTAVFYSPNAIVMNPLDWKTIRLTTDNNGQFYGGSMFGTNYGYAANGGGNGYVGGSANTLWNTPVVQTPVMPQGTILVGYFGQEAAQVARREGLSMQMTNFNGTNFVDGEVTLRAEERLGLMVYRPAAFELIQLAPAA
jgi:HK97 family phage major capsid protein